MKISRHHLSIAVCAAMALALAVWQWPHDAQPHKTDVRTMQSSTQTMATRCVGRFLIDVPAEATEVRGQYGLRIASIQPIQKTNRPAAETLHRLDRELDQRAASQQGRHDVYGKPMLNTTVYRPGPLVRSIRSAAMLSGAGPQMDGYVIRLGGTFIFETIAYDDEDIENFNDLLLEIEPTLSVRENSVIPTTPGFCIDDGFIAMNPKQGENAAFGWELADHPDVRFSLSTQSNDDKVDPGHLDVEGATVSYMGSLMSSVKTLRKRRFELIGMPAQEWSVEITDSPEYEFRIEIPGAPNDKARPFITLSMRVGNANMKLKPSLSTGEALALWDAVIQTLRLRPGAV